MKAFPFRWILPLIAVFFLSHLLQAQPLFERHYDSSSDPVLLGGVLQVCTQSIDTVCSELAITVTDTTNAPLGPFTPARIDPVDGLGNQIVDLSGNMRFYVRVRSADTIRLCMQLRAGDGSAPFRSQPVERTVPGDLQNWYVFEYTFTGVNLGGFDSTDLRDLWLYFDRGDNNFKGNDVRIDFVSIGALPALNDYSTCAGMLTDLPYALNWDSGADPVLTGSGSATLTQNIDSTCEELQVSVTDPVGNPLGSFAPLTLNPVNGAGDDLTDLSGYMQFHIRARSADTVRIGLELRSADGSPAFRSGVIQQTIPGDLQNWYLLTYVYDTSNLGGFDSTDFRDLWIYFDRGDNNFAGNDVRLDFVAIGALPDTADWSPCFPPSPTTPDLPYVLNWNSASDPLITGGPSSTLTQNIDIPCEELQVSVSDPTGNPLGSFAPLTINPVNGSGSDLTDLSGYMQFHIRARSADTVRIGLELRSADGSAPFRSDVIQQTVPGDLQSWTLLTYVYDTSNLGGFDSTDFRDLWLYFDRGDDNFAGNDIRLDFVAIGELPDTSLWSPCLAADPPMADLPWLLNWDASDDPIITGSSASKLDQIIDTVCQELAVAVNDPVGNPLGSFAPLTINPVNATGSDLTDLSGYMQFHIRARSADTVRIGLELRSADGSAPFRSDVIQQTVPGDLQSWTLLTYVYDTSNLGGFDSTDFRDLWLYFDRGDDNFAGNDIHLDFIAIGELPDTSLWSPCLAADPPMADLPWLLNWDASDDPIITGSSASKLDQIIDTVCQELAVAVNDPVGNPLGSFAPLTINPVNATGSDLTDLSGYMQFHIRARSADTVRIGLELRSADGSAPFRSDVIQQTVPGDLQSWTLLTYVYDTSNLGGFDSTDFRDLWLYFDRGDDNFAGNDLHLDFIAIGELPDTSLWSPCLAADPPMADLPWLLNWDASDDPIITGSSASKLDQIIDTVCQELAVAVSDPVGNPLGSFAPLTINPVNGAGSDLTDLSGYMQFHIRARSADTVRIGLELRSADGAAPFRSDVIQQTVPGDLQSWTLLTYVYDTSNLGGFDSTDFRDLWLYFDRGDDNFAGNDIHLDFIAIGELPDTSLWSPCLMVDPPMADLPWLLNWDASDDPIITGSSASKLDQIIDTVCQELAVAVNDPVGNPLGSFAPLTINPVNGAGSDLTDLSGYMQFHIRARSADTVRIGLELRSADGSPAFRSDVIQQTVPGDLQSWTLLTYVYDTSNLGGFDSTDFRDLWLYFDRGDDNFAGNDIHLDFIAIGELPDTSLWSPCLMVDPPMADLPWLLNWDASDDPIITGSSAPKLDQIIDTVCQELAVAVNDPVGNPLGSFAPLTINPVNANGDDLTDLSGFMQFHIRARSADSVRIGLELRSADGSPAFRSDVIQQTVPDDLQNWTLLSFVYDTSNIEGFDSTDFRDLWLYFDRGDDNFAGNDLHLDFIAIGELPDTSLWSPCLTPEPPNFVFPYVLNWSSSLEPQFGGGPASTLTQVSDTICEELEVSVTDTISNPLGSFAPLTFNPQDSAGNDYMDLSGQMHFYLRLRSADSLNIGMQLRSADGSAGNRSLVVEQAIGGDLQSWTLLEFTFNGADLDGFDSTDLHDIWIYLDRGQDNFRGNELYIDFFSIGSLPDNNSWSPCPLGPQPTFPYIINWDDQNDPIFGGASGAKLNQDIDLLCEELDLSVADPSGNPLGSFAPLTINPLDPLGAEITDLSGQMRFYVRARSADSVRIGMQLRSADGTAANRSLVIEHTIPAGLDEWHWYEYIFAGADLDGFDSTDFRDVWLYFDRGDDNFAGNDLHLDFFSIGAIPDESTWSACYADYPALHWDDATDPVLAGSNSNLLDQNIDPSCSELALRVADSLAAPVGPTASFTINPQNAAGQDITNLTGNMKFYLRARSIDTVRIGMQLRSGDGSPASRSFIVERTLYPDLSEWSILEFSFPGINLAGFDSTDLRDVWLFFDEGQENFRGNDLRLDFFSIGRLPAGSTYSTCIETAGLFPYILNWRDTTDQISGGAGAALLTQNIDSVCEALSISVTDPINAPHDPFTPASFNPTNANGDEITDLSGNMSFFVRARSRDSLTLTMQLRSRDGTPAFRSQRVDQLLPGGFQQWHLLEFEFNASNLAGFDSTDFRDIWLFFDRLEPNFPGNEIQIDFLSIGGLPPMNRWSDCFDSDFVFPYVEQWEEYSDKHFAGPQVALLDQHIDLTCEEIEISVADPTNNPYPAGQTLYWNPRDQYGNEYTDISGQMRVYLRARSAATIDIEVMLRGGDGSAASSTQEVSQTLTGDLFNWYELEYVFSGGQIGGFDPAEFLDIAIKIDPANANISGNEIHFDYLSLGDEPDNATNTPCLNTDIQVESGKTLIEVYPNPLTSGEEINLAVEASKASEWNISLWSVTGQRMAEMMRFIPSGKSLHAIPLPKLSPGIYWIQMQNGQERLSQAIRIR